MENFTKTSTHEVTPDTKESKKTKKKKAENLGAFIIEPKKHTKAESSDKPSIFDFGEKKGKITDSDAPARTENIKSAENDADVPLDSLSPAERQEAVEVIVAERASEQVLSTHESEAEQLAEAAVQQFRQNIIENGQDIETAEASVYADLGIDSNEVKIGNQVEGDENIEEYHEADVETEEENSSITEHVAGEPKDDEDPVITNSRGTAGSPPKAIGANGGGVPPPRSYVGLVGAASMPPLGGFNALPVANTAPNASGAPTEVIVDRRNTSSHLLLGGLTGYFVGRRRGRIKTEKKLLPTQAKLRKEVSSLRDQVQQKESVIRATTIKQARANKLRRLERSSNTSAVLEAPQETVKPHTMMPETTKAAVPAGTENARSSTKKELRVTDRKTFEQKAAESVKIDQNRARKEQEAPTHLGKMIVTAEAVVAARPKREQNAVAPEVTTKQIETLNRAELMRLSEKIVVGGTSLRQIYESKLVGEKGLRRLVREHLRGGDVKKVLRREIVEREIDFERDPILRDSDHAGESFRGSGKATTLNKMLKAVENSNDTSAEEVAFYRSRAEYAKKETGKATKKRKLMDISLILTITVLSVFIVLLMLERA
ncbi:MAG: hypothetical protein QFB86_02380 [Patescibacteria group bacterium]|nr:hypothetical protein [Patescibacteria group bacterium]